MYILTKLFAPRNKLLQYRNVYIDSVEVFLASVWLCFTLFLLNILQELLTTLSVEKLVSKDTSMVHEIRVRNFSIFQKELPYFLLVVTTIVAYWIGVVHITISLAAILNFWWHSILFLSSQALDGDMQMLVYENYNKFISATETIKRMKNNVDAMDSDMEAVRYFAYLHVHQSGLSYNWIDTAAIYLSISYYFSSILSPHLFTIFSSLLFLHYLLIICIHLSHPN